MRLYSLLVKLLTYIIITYLTVTCVWIIVYLVELKEAATQYGIRVAGSETAIVIFVLLLSISAVFGVLGAQLLKTGLSWGFFAAGIIAVMANSRTLFGNTARDVSALIAVGVFICIVVFQMKITKAYKASKM